MQETEVRQLLEEAFSAEIGILGDTFSTHRNSRKGALRSYGKTKVTSERSYGKTYKNLYPTAWGLLTRQIRCASVLEEENHLIIVAGSGAMQMNPAVVELRFSGTGVEMTAWAKEGLIKQHTAQKAIQACAKALGLTQQ